MSTSILTWQRVLGLGAITGMRSMSGPALLSNAAARGAVPGLDDSLFKPLAARGISLGFAVLALGEILADKFLPLPNRNRGGPLLGRAVFGGLVGAALIAAEDGPIVAGAAIGAVSAAAAAIGSYHLRAVAVYKLGIPDFVVALAEDVVALGSGNLLLQAKTPLFRLGGE